MMPGPHSKVTGPCNDFMFSDKYILGDGIPHYIKIFDYDALAIIFTINLRINGAIRI